MYRIINKIHEIWLKNNYFSKEKYGKLNIFYKKFFELDIIKSSQALAFISFFSIVPIYAFFFFVLAALSEKDAEKLTAFVGQYVFPEYIDALTIFLDNLSSQIIKIGAIGLPFLMLTAILQSTYKCWRGQFSLEKHLFQKVLLKQRKKMHKSELWKKMK